MNDISNKKFLIQLSLFSLLLLSIFTIHLCGQIPSNEHSAQLQLTDDEKKWLSRHKTISVGMDPEYAPYEWIDTNGKRLGMAVEYIHKLEEILGVHFLIIENKTWVELLDMAKNGQLDMLTSIVKTPERSKYLTFSEPYRDTPTIIIDNGDGDFIGSLKQLSNKKVSVEKGYFMEEFMKNNYPKILLIRANSTQEALKMVADGVADAYVGDANVAVYAIKINNFDTLRFSGQTEYISHQSFALSKGNEPLVGILTKAMATIPKEESDAMFNHWMNVESGIKQETIIKYSLAIALILIFFIYRNNILKKYNLNLENAQTRLTNEAKEKEILFQELDHRVKNNLQIISSIVSLHSSKEDTSQALEDINNTISAISLAHDKLHHNTTHNTLEIKNYINVLLDNLLSSSILKIQKEINSPLIYLNAEEAVTLGIIINEFISNSIKYAFDGVDSPKIMVNIQEDKNFLSIIISDNGIGLKDNIQSSGLGMDIIKTLSKSKFKTEAKFFYNNGTSLELKIALK